MITLLNLLRQKKDIKNYNEDTKNKNRWIFYDHIIKNNYKIPYYNNNQKKYLYDTISMKNSMIDIMLYFSTVEYLNKDIIDFTTHITNPINTNNNLLK